ncbi:MAG TPA: MOSC domain-containing protein [Bryobacteraceae bacterium]|nr:MOSC domain-containing protein [Bryobacteraceae bacterium]
MVVDEHGVFLSQRKLPRLVLIAPRFEDSDLVVTAPGVSSLVIPRWSGQGEWIPVRIWRDHLKLPHPNQAYSDWFSSFLGRPCHLVYLPDDIKRHVEPPFDDPKWRVSLADGYPLLIVTQASLDLLNTKRPSPIGMEHFRPNLVIAGATPHAEDRWTNIQIASARLAIVKPCARCSTVLVDPATAKVGTEPLKTLAEYRRLPRGVMFGQNALVVTPGQLRVGNAVEITNQK